LETITSCLGVSVTWNLIYFQPNPCVPLQLMVSLEGVRDLTKIEVDVVDGTEFELEVSGLYRCEADHIHFRGSVFS